MGPSRYGWHSHTPALQKPPGRNGEEVSHIQKWAVPAQPWLSHGYEISRKNLLAQNELSQPIIAQEELGYPAPWFHQGSLSASACRIFTVERATGYEPLEARNLSSHSPPGPERPECSSPMPRTSHATSREHHLANPSEAGLGSSEQKSTWPDETSCYRANMALIRQSCQEYETHKTAMLRIWYI